MKLFTDLTIAEKAELTTDQIDQYIDYRCAEYGSPLVPPKPEKVEATELDKTEVYYEVSIGWQTMFNKKDAQDIVDFINRKKKFASKRVGSYNSPEWVDVQEDEQAGVRAKKYYTESVAHKQHEINKEEKLELETYENRIEAFNEAIESRTEHVTSITSEIHDARSTIQLEDSYLADWNKYFELAGDDIDIAKNFFINRYSTDIYFNVIVPKYDILSE